MMITRETEGGICGNRDEHYFSTTKGGQFSVITGGHFSSSVTTLALPARTLSLASSADGHIDDAFVFRFE